jgi:hypothetical protein
MRSKKAWYCAAMARSRSRMVFSSLPPSPAEVQFMEPVMTHSPSMAADFMCILPPQRSTMTGMPTARSSSCLV